MSTPAALRQVNIYNGQLYASYISSAGTRGRVATVGTDLPTAPPQTVVDLSGITPSDGPHAFFLADLSVAVPGVDPLYVADEDRGPVGQT